ncbi:MAG TPA: response regulator [Caulobacteraceae bacterium]
MPLNLLLVDDNPRIRQLLRTILGELDDIQIRESSDGRAAIEACSVWKPDIAIVDCEMSPMDGLEFTERVRAGATPVPANLPIIMMTGHAEVQRVMRAREVGVSDFIAKPLSVGAVLGRLQRTLSANAHQNRDGRIARSPYVLLSEC